MSDDHVTNKRNCICCGTVMAYGWALTCPACVTNQKLEEQNQILLNANPGRSGITSYSSGNDSFGIGSILFVMFLGWVAIGFIFFPQWGIVAFAKFLWTVFLFLCACVLAIPYALFQLLF